MSPRLPTDKYSHQAPDGPEGEGKFVGDSKLDLVWTGLKGLEFMWTMANLTLSFHIDNKTNPETHMHKWVQVNLGNAE